VKINQLIRKLLESNNMNVQIFFVIATTLLPVLHTLPSGSRWQHGKGKLQGPVNQTVSEGSDVVLQCRDIQSYMGPQSKCHWLKDGFMITNSGRYKVSDNCDLRISPVMPLDEGSYQCQVGGGGGQVMLSSSGELRVDTEPGTPHILDSEAGVILDHGDILQLVCQSSGARPAASIDWWDGETGEKIMSQVTNDVVRQGRGFATTSTLRFKPTKPMKIYCTAHSEAFPALKQSAPVDVAIRGQPRTETIDLREGDSVKIFCHNKVINDVLRFKWFINDILIDGENRDVLEITDFNKDYDKSQVKCVVSDRAGKEEIIRVVELTHNQEKDRSPRVISRTFSNLDRNKPKHDVMLNDEDDSSFQEDDAIIKEFDETTKGEKTTFICVVEDDDESVSSSEPKYVWVNGKLTLNRNDAVDEDTKKQYKCKVVRNGVKKIQKLSKDLKTYSKSFKKMSKYLNNFSKY